MFIPEGKTEAEVLEVIQAVAEQLCGILKIPGYTKEDMAQEGRLLAIEALPSYDGVRPLAPFLYIHVHNRLCNLFRNKVRRNDPPCIACHFGEPCEGAFTEGGCPAYRNWRSRQDAKSGLMSPGPIYEHDVERPSGEEEVERRELLGKIEGGMPADLRADYLRMLAGVKLTRDREERVLAAIRGIL